jgi:RNA polymerase sigma-70 factor, ECF subfamily
MTWLFAILAAVHADPGEQATGAAAVARAAAGDEAALGVLYDTHARAMYSLALRILGDESDAEEVTQDVFAQAWRQAGRYDASRGTVAAWLLNMTRTRAIDRLRARRARPDSSAARAAEELSPALTAPYVDPGDALGVARDAERVRAALQQLPLLQRLAIELAYFEGLTQTEIAERLEQPLGTVKTRIRLGLSKLRESLSGSVAGGTA